MTTAKSTFAVKSWETKPYLEIEGEVKFTNEIVTKTFSGDIEGESTLNYLMVYLDGGETTFVGLERITGKIGDQSGSFVIRHTGIDDGNSVKGEYFVVPGSGTGDLKGLRGTGKTELAGHAENYPFDLDYSFD